MQTWELKIKVSVADSWIADGFNMKERLEDLQDQVKSMLPYAYGHEVKVKATILTHPNYEVINQLQDGRLEAKD